jgi:NADH-quinone oxidoreductase subunit C
MKQIQELLEQSQITVNIDSNEHIIVNRDDLVRALELLKNSPDVAANMLIDLFVADFPSRTLRFEIVYNLLSLRTNKRYIVKIHVEDQQNVESIHSLFPNSVWYEREAFDMFGVEFNNSLDSRRILTDYGFEGHPLRKDFPLTGYVQVTYDETLEKVVYEPVKLDQEFRTFNFLSPWQQNNTILPGDEKASKND